MNMMQVRLLSGVVVIALVLLYAFDYISLPVFIALVVIETVITMAVTFKIIRDDRASSGLPDDIQARVDREESIR